MSSPSANTTDPTHPLDPAAKIVSRDDLVRRLGRPRSNTVVFTNGCFDVLHRGHVEYLASARSLGDVLVVGLNSDDSVRRLKGPGRPVNSEEDRAFVLAGLAAVDYVTVFGEDTPRELIAALLPDVLVKGGDYRRETIVGADEVEAAGGRVVVAPLVPGRSTTSIIERVRQGERDGC
jgi:rfaE bifunctional protein nucleotidyltransferase chain/domain